MRISTLVEPLEVHAAPPRPTPPDPGRKCADPQARAVRQEHRRRVRDTYASQLRLEMRLPVDQLAALKRLRKNIANRNNMRRYRAENRYDHLCAGIDLPLEAGTCGRWVERRFERCIRCSNRRRWLLHQACNPAEVAIATLLDGCDSGAADVLDAPGAGSADRLNGAALDAAADMTAANDAHLDELDELDELLDGRRDHTIAPLLDNAGGDVPDGDACLRW